MSLLLTPYSLLPIQRIDSLASSSWFGGLVLIVLIAFALSVSAHRKQYTLYVRNLVNKQGRVMNYDQESTSAWADIFLWFVVFASFALLLKTQLQVNFVILFTIVVSYFGLKWLLFAFLGYVFGVREVAKSFTLDYFVLIALLGLMFLPISLGIVYYPEIPSFVWIGLVVFIALIVLLILFIKLLQFFYSGFGSLFYIFLYLCTSEILPLFMAAKVASIVVINV